MWKPLRVIDLVDGITRGLSTAVRLLTQPSDEELYLMLLWCLLLIYALGIYFFLT